MSTYFLFQARSIKSEISHSFIASHKNLMKTTKSKKHSTITVVHVIIDIESARRTSLWYSVILSTYIWADTSCKIIKPISPKSRVTLFCRDTIQKGKAR